MAYNWRNPSNTWPDDEWFAYFNDLGNLSGLQSETQLRQAHESYEKMKEEAMEKGFKIENLRQLQLLHANQRNKNAEIRKEVKDKCGIDP